MTSRYDQLCADLRREFPRFAIVRKDHSPLQRAIAIGLTIITAGQMRTYLDDFQTTIGSTVYVTPDWDSRVDDERYVTMRHEAVHMRQFRQFTLPGMALLYLLLPLPMGLAWFRTRFEMAAYAEGIVAAAEIWGEAHVRDPRYRASVLRNFTGAAYGWMWPFQRSLDRWYDRVLDGLSPSRA